MIAIYDWFGYELPIKKRYELIKRAGFDSVLLWWSNGFGRDIDGIDEYLKGPLLARKAGLNIENIHTPVENQNRLWDNNINGEALLNTYLKCIEDCMKFDIQTMVIHLPNDDYQCTVLGIDRIKQIADDAERKNVNVAFENLRSLNNLRTVFKEVNSNKIGFCYDSGHHYRHYANEDLLSEFGSRLMAIHLHDNNGKLAQHGLPYDGTTDWDKTMKKLADSNYKGNIAIEAMNWEYEHLAIEFFLKEAAERANKLEKLFNR